VDTRQSKACHLVAGAVINSHAKSQQAAGIDVGCQLQLELAMGPMLMYGLISKEMTFKDVPCKTLTTVKAVPRELHLLLGT
jgi:hypothetical protein